VYVLLCVRGVCVCSELTIRNNAHLGGTIPTSIVAAVQQLPFPSLQILDLSGNNLTGTVPQVLCDTTDITVNLLDNPLLQCSDGCFVCQATS
jgi:hypothetical protein